jgi:hypothetical protein
MLRWEDFPDGPPANYTVEFLRAEFRKRLYREGNMNFRGFPSIEGFHVVVKTGQHLNAAAHSYRGKIKLHGTNAGIRVSNGEIAAQSRTKIITLQDDNAGFARWVEANKAYWSSLPLADHTVFGEWCGRGIEKGTALNLLPAKLFAVFAIMVGEGESAVIISEPADIAMLLGERPVDVHVLPWCCDSFDVNFENREHLQAIADKLNKFVDEIEPCDPWVKSVFGVEGVCEGAVYYPGAGQQVSVETFTNFAFKAKGEKHKVVRTKEAVQIDPEVAASIDEFVKMFVTENRLEQGLSVTGPAEMKNTGAFLKWICQDVEKESKTELAASNLTWDQAQKAVQLTARNWYKEKAMAIV